MRKNLMMLRVGDAEMQRFRMTAESKGLKTASWARMALLEASRASAAAELPPLAAPKSTLNLLSLFCGPGGLDTGFEDAQFQTDLAFDIDQECVNTFNFNHKSANPNKPKAHVRDIRQLTIEEMDSLLGKQIKPIGVIGGPPCQSFSVSNVHQSDDDPRHSLPVAYAKLLSQLNKRNPISFFVFENVPGLLGPKHRDRYEMFKGLFRKAGFELKENLVNAVDYGVPQDRPRIIIVGINRDLYPNAKWEMPPTEPAIKTVKDTIGHLKEPVMNGADIPFDEFPEHPNHWCLVPRSKKFAKKGMLEEGQSWGRSFRTLSWDKPSWTVAYGHREVHVHPNGRRRLSIYEAMLLQSFPERYRLTGNMSAQIRLVSEAVPPRMGRHFANAIRRCLGI